MRQHSEILGASPRRVKRGLSPGMRRLRLMTPGSERPGRAYEPVTAEPLASRGRYVPSKNMAAGCEAGSCAACV